MNELSLVFKFSFLLFIIKKTTSQECDLSQIFRTPKDMSKVNMDHFELIERGNFDQSVESTTVSPTNEQATSTATETSPKTYANAQVLLRFGGDNIQGQNRIFVPPQCRRLFDREGNYGVPHHQNYYYPPAPHHAPTPTYYPYPPPTPFVFPNYYYHCPPYLPPQLQKYYMLTPNGYLQPRNFHRQDVGKLTNAEQGFSAGPKSPEETDAILDLIRENQITPFKNKHHPKILQPTDLTNEQITSVNLEDDIKVNFSENDDEINPDSEYLARKTKTKHSSRRNSEKLCRKSGKNNKTEKHIDKNYFQRESQDAEQQFNEEFVMAQEESLESPEKTSHSHIQKINNSVDKISSNSEEYSEESSEENSHEFSEENSQQFSDELTEEYTESPAVVENFAEKPITIVQNPIVVAPKSEESFENDSTANVDFSSSSEEVSSEIVEVKAAAKSKVSNPNSLPAQKKAGKSCIKKNSKVKTNIKKETSKPCLKKASKAVRGPDVRFVIIDANKLKNKSSQHIDQLLNEALVPYLCKKCGNDKPKMLVSYPVTSENEEKDATPRILQGDSCPMCYRNPDTPFGKRFQSDVDVLGALDTSNIVNDCKCKKCNCANCGCRNTNNIDKRPAGGKGFEKDVDDLFEYVIFSLASVLPTGLETYQDISPGANSFPQSYVYESPVSSSIPNLLPNNYDTYYDAASLSYTIDPIHMGSLQQDIKTPKNSVQQPYYAPATGYATSGYYQEGKPSLEDYGKAMPSRNIKQCRNRRPNNNRAVQKKSKNIEYLKVVPKFDIIPRPDLQPQPINLVPVDMPGVYQPNYDQANDSRSFFIDDDSNMNFANNDEYVSPYVTPESQVQRTSTFRPHNEPFNNFDSNRVHHVLNRPKPNIPNHGQSYDKNTNFEIYISARPAARDPAALVSNNRPVTDVAYSDVKYINRRPTVGHNSPISGNTRHVAVSNPEFDANHIDAVPYPSSRDTRPAPPNTIRYVNTRQVPDSEKITYVNTESIPDTDRINYIDALPYPSSRDTRPAPSNTIRYVNTRQVPDSGTITYVNTEAIPDTVNSIPASNANTVTYVNIRPVTDTNTVRYVNTRPVVGANILDSDNFANSMPLEYQDNEVVVVDKPIVNNPSRAPRRGQLSSTPGNKPPVVPNGNSGKNSKYCHRCGQALSFYPSTGGHYCSTCPKETDQLNAF